MNEIVAASLQPIPYGLADTVRAQLRSIATYGSGFIADSRIEFLLYVAGVITRAGKINNNVVYLPANTLAREALAAI